MFLGAPRVRRPTLFVSSTVTNHSSKMLFPIPRYEVSPDHGTGRRHSLRASVATLPLLVASLVLTGCGTTTAPSFAGGGGADLSWPCDTRCIRAL